MLELTRQNVDQVVQDCRWNDVETVDQAQVVEGIAHNVGFSPPRLEEHVEDIEDMLSQLPRQFNEGDEGGGWSFLNACNREDGVQWTGLHLQMEMLFLLGIGIGKVHWMLPRDVWRALPGGVPYVVIRTDREVPDGA